MTTPDLDATLEAVAAHGGSTLWGPIDATGVGRVAALCDPQGGVMGLLEPAGDAPGSDDPPGMGEVSWNELATTDWRAAYDFYVDVFGWQHADDMDMGEAGIYRMYSRGAHPLGGMFDKSDDMPVTAWLYYIHVPDVKAAVAAVEAEGGRVLNGPMEVPGGDLVAQCMDPQGAAFALHSRAG